MVIISSTIQSSQSGPMMRTSGDPGISLTVEMIRKLFILFVLGKTMFNKGKPVCKRIKDSCSEYIFFLKKNDLDSAKRATQASQ